MEEWKHALLLINDYAFGNGPGWVPNLFFRMSSGKHTFMSLHNEWLEMVIAFGLVGSFLILYPIAKSAIKIKNIDNELRPYVWSMISFFPVAVFWFPMHAPSIAFIVLTCVSVILKKGDIK